MTGGIKLKVTARTLSLTAALAVMIPLSAYAATSGSSSGDGAVKVEKTTATAYNGDFRGHGHKGGFGGKGEVVSQEVLDLLKLDQATLSEKLKAGSTLAEIAKQQGVSRDSLKAAMTDAFNKKLEQRKTEFAAGLDKLIDSDLTAFHGKIGFGGKLDLTAVSTVLGVTADELQTSLQGGKSLADVAKDKKVDVQKVIDSVAASITRQINQAVKDGKLTQAEADKRLADVSEIAGKMVNGKGFGPGPDGHRGGHGGRGFGGERWEKGAASGSTETTPSPSASASASASAQS